MNPFEFVLAIIVVIGDRRFASCGTRDGHTVAAVGSTGGEPQKAPETLRLREEVKELKERLKVLERITVEKENSLAKEIESLRDR